MQIPVEIPGIPKKSPREMVPLSQAVLGRKCHGGTSRKTDGVTVGGRGRGRGDGGGEGRRRPERCNRARHRCKGASGSVVWIAPFLNHPIYLWHACL